ncbi:MAG: alanine racemase, partial [Armatimonadota bacterium]|nr:alanine racemase [Armatimonadota bacterium]
ICMDQMMIALPDDAAAEVGDSVVLLGRQGQEQITTEELAGKAGTIMHELLARLGTRMPRVYKGTGPIINE